MTVPMIMPPPEEQLPQPPASPLIVHPLSGDTISPAYIHTVQHLIEKCLLFKLNQDECVSALEKHARVNPVVTRIVWSELEKVNPEFFAAYNLQRPDDSTDSSTCDPLDRALLEATTTIATTSSHAT